MKAILERQRRLDQPPAGPPGPIDFLGVPAGVRELVRCPACLGRLSPDHGELLCAAPWCATRYPVVGQVPVLVNDEESLFRRADIVGRQDSLFTPSRSWLKRWLDRKLPTLGSNLKANGNYGLLARLLLERSRKPLVLVIGGRVLGQGMEALIVHPEIRLMETDVALGPRTQIVCDAHELPFDNHTFDGAVVQAVLPYVLDPIKCVQEIERVLKPAGLAYAETAFMQQVVHGRYDFTRFTHLALRRLFRHFQEVQSGPVAGPGMVLAWACHFFLLSFVTRRLTRSLIHAVVRLTLFWLKYFDPLLMTRAGTYDAASGFFFLGRLSAGILSDRELVTLYRGAQ